MLPKAIAMRRSQIIQSPKVKAPMMAICASAQQLNEWYHILTSYFEK